MDKTCYIVGSGDFDKTQFNPQPDDFVIAADGGLAYTNNKENLIIGDFDSVRKPTFGNILSLPCEKNDTDVGYAISHALSLGYKNFKLFGVLGGRRLSHTVGNIQLLLHLYHSNASGILYGNKTICYIIDKEKSYPANKIGFISLFALTKSIVTLKGLKYTLVNHSLIPSYPLGISNEFTKKPSQVLIKEGLLLAIEEDYD